jgi:hypothetical protein
MTWSMDLVEHGAKDWKSRDRQAGGRGCTNSEFTIHNSLFRIALACSWYLTLF